MEIDLDVQMNPHPKLVQAFKDANALNISFELGGEDSGNYRSPEFSNEKRIFFASKASKLTV